jgi:predicted RNA-binding protein with PUA domain
MAEKCNCGETGQGSCGGCGMEEILAYWCETCKRSVPDKRCPECGLKSKRKKE